MVKWHKILGLAVLLFHSASLARAAETPYLFTTLAGSPIKEPAVDGPIGQARFASIYGIAVDQAGNVFVSDDTAIRKIGIDGMVTTVAGKIGSAGNVDGPGSEARFSAPAPLTMDGNGNLY